MAALSLLSACTSQKIHRDVLVPSLSVGVHGDDTTAGQLTELLFPASYSNGALPPYGIDYTSMDDLQRGLDQGTYDVVIGPLRNIRSNNRLGLEALAIQEIYLSYFHLPKREDLAHVSEREAFFSRMKSVGYVSSGEIGRVNSALVKSHPNAYRFEPCGSKMSCIYMLNRDQIDSFATTGDEFIADLQESLPENDLNIARSNYREKNSFGVAMNRASLSKEEIQELTDIFSRMSISAFGERK